MISGQSLSLIDVSRLCKNQIIYIAKRCKILIFNFCNKYWIKTRIGAESNKFIVKSQAVCQISKVENRILTVFVGGSFGICYIGDIPNLIHSCSIADGETIQFIGTFSDVKVSEIHLSIVEVQILFVLYFCIIKVKFRNRIGTDIGCVIKLNTGSALVAQCSLRSKGNKTFGITSQRFFICKSIDIHSDSPGLCFTTYNLRSESDSIIWIYGTSGIKNDFTISCDDIARPDFS